MAAKTENVSAQARRRDARRTTRSSATVLAQVRLRAEEAAALREAMAALHIESTSDALREGLRLLTREATEVVAAEQIRTYYHGSLAPVPEGVEPVSAEDLAAADAAQW